MMSRSKIFVEAAVAAAAAAPVAEFIMLCVSLEGDGVSMWFSFYVEFVAEMRMMMLVSC